MNRDHKSSQKSNQQNKKVKKNEEKKINKIVEGKTNHFPFNIQQSPTPNTHTHTKNADIEVEKLLCFLWSFSSLGYILFIIRFCVCVSTASIDYALSYIRCSNVLHVCGVNIISWVRLLDTFFVAYLLVGQLMKPDYESLEKILLAHNILWQGI